MAIERHADGQRYIHCDRPQCGAFTVLSSEGECEYIALFSAPPPPEGFDANPVPCPVLFVCPACQRDMNVCWMSLRVSQLLGENPSVGLFWHRAGNVDDILH